MMNAIGHMLNKTSPITIYDSPYSVKETIDRIENFLRERNVTIFGRIDHGAGARQAGFDMQDEELLIFGNPKIGTDLILDNPAIGIDLPLKILAWSDDSGTKVGHHKLESLFEKYGVHNKAVISNMTETVRAIVTIAIKNP
jgi:beta-galactosidase